MVFTMQRQFWLVVMVWCLGGMVRGHGGFDPQGPPPPPPPTDDGGTDVLCDLYGEDATYTETVSGSVRNIQGSGCANHWTGCQKEGICTGYTTQEAMVQDVDEDVLAYPVLASEDDMLDLSCEPGTIGIALNSVALFGPGDGTIGDDCGSATPLEGDTWDLCSGHAEPVEGAYHYHILPTCLLDQLGGVTSGPGGHSPQIGWVYDGFPIYGPRGPEGVKMKPCNTTGANATYCLDSCNGYEGTLPDVDDFLYRYYITGSVGDLTCSATVDNTDSGVCQGDPDSMCCVDHVPDETYDPYLIGCFRGCLYTDTDCQTNAEGVGYSSAYVPEALSGVTDLYIAEGVSFLYPSNAPTTAPSSAPTAGDQGSRSPSTVPSPAPTTIPTTLPTAAPSTQPTRAPSAQPTTPPSSLPSDIPTLAPSVVPSTPPTVAPSTLPTTVPTPQPSMRPTSMPSHRPTAAPTQSPTATRFGTIECAVTLNGVTLEEARQADFQKAYRKTMAIEAGNNISANDVVITNTTDGTERRSRHRRLSAVEITSDIVVADRAANETLTTLEDSLNDTAAFVDTLNTEIVEVASNSSNATSSGGNGTSVVVVSDATVNDIGYIAPIITDTPSMAPTSAPSQMPSAQPSGYPSAVPTPNPTIVPTAFPSVQPSAGPSAMPTVAPSVDPTTAPSAHPSAVATAVPTPQPSTSGSGGLADDDGDDDGEAGNFTTALTSEIVVGAGAAGGGALAVVVFCLGARRYLRQRRDDQHQKEHDEAFAGFDSLDRTSNPMFELGTSAQTPPQQPQAQQQHVHAQIPSGPPPPYPGVQPPPAGQQGHLLNLNYSASAPPSSTAPQPQQYAGGPGPGYNQTVEIG